MSVAALASAPIFAADKSDKPLARETMDAQEPPAAVDAVKGNNGNGNGNGNGNAGTAGASSIPNLTWHFGPILPRVTTRPIFWGTSWATYSGDMISGINSFYAGISNTPYIKTNGEYVGSNGAVGATVTALPAITDTTAAPTGAPKTSAILAEVCARIPASEIPTDGTGYYPVYSDQKRGTAGYCAWHSAGSCNGRTFAFAFFFNLDGDPGCDPGNDFTYTGHSNALRAAASVSGHELSETVTDPRLNAWYDKNGAENADKCAWTFSGKMVQFNNGTQWKIQGNFSNAANNAGTGYTRGCIDGN